jgi:hypothetical protein
MASLCEIFFEMLHGDQMLDPSDDEEDFLMEEIVLDAVCSELLLDYSQIPNILVQKHVASIVRLPFSELRRQDFQHC